MTEEPPAHSPQLAAPVPDFDAVRRAIAEAAHPCHFLVGPRLRLEWLSAAQEEIPWEIYRGRLLDASQTRQQQTFEAWSLFQTDETGRSTDPLLSIKLDAAAAQLHVVRAIYSHAWEAYDSGDNVILSRETRKWLRELVGSVDLTRTSDPEAVRAAVAELLFQALVGISRLPLTSIEAPLPGFTLGALAYFPHTATGMEPMHSAAELIDRALTSGPSARQQAKLLEALLRLTPSQELPDVADRFVARWHMLGRAPSAIAALLRTVFNEVALSPYTDFVDKSLAFLRILELRGHISPAEHADFLGFLLRHLARHLTAYDLVVYHHRGANYPDALLLDAALRAFLDLAERHPSLFVAQPDDPGVAAQHKRLRRRALRMALLLRRQYEGHEVPDAPTSPGENTRVLPAPHVRVPEEQILDPTRRQRKLFAGDSPALVLTELARELFRQSCTDLEHPLELRELGTALFLDRPLGFCKRPGEPDRTPLLSHEAFSPSIAERRLGVLGEMLGQPYVRSDRLQPVMVASDRLKPVTTNERSKNVGLALQPSRMPARPGVVSLDDALQVASDFALLRTTRQTATEFFARYQMPALAARFAIADLFGNARVSIVSGAHIRGGQPGTLVICDDHFRPRLEFEIDAQQGYISRTDGEDPAGGLRLLRVWEATPSGDLEERDLRAENVRLGHSGL